MLIATGVAVLAAIVAGGIWRMHDVVPGSVRSDAVKDAASGEATATAEPRADTTRSPRKNPSQRAPQRISAQVPLPPSGAPLAQIYDELKARAEAGDAEAATRLFHEVHRCIEVRQTHRLLAEIHSMTADHPDEIGIVRDGQVQIKVVHEMTDYVQANGARCEGATDAQLAGFTPLLLQAAQFGDLKALDCYVGTDFDRMEGVLDHPEWIHQYRAQAPGLVESALQRGDWVIVDLLHHAYSGAFDTSARGQLFGSDPVMEYRLLRLEQLGATGRFADWLAPKVAGAAKALSPVQFAAAEAWANDYYSRYFNSASNEVSNGANICQITDD